MKKVRNVKKKKLKKDCENETPRLGACWCQGWFKYGTTSCLGYIYDFGSHTHLIALLMYSHFLLRL